MDYFLDNKEPRGDRSTGQTTWSLAKIFTPLERSAHSPWEKLIKNLLSHLSPLVKVGLRWVFFVWGNTGIALLTRLLGAWQRFYHHWKGLIELHEESWSEFSFLVALLLSDRRIEEYYWRKDVTRGSSCWQDYIVVDRDFTTIGKVCSIYIRKCSKFPFCWILLSIISIKINEVLVGWCFLSSLETSNHRLHTEILSRRSL